MLSFAGIIKKMNSLKFSCIFFILVPHTISFGNCDDISFSICWMSRDDAAERQTGNIWLNGTALGSIRTAGKLTSLTVSPNVKNKLTLQHGSSVKTWILKVIPLTKFIEIKGWRKPLEHPTNTTQAILESLSPSEVFACENGTLFFYQDENFFLSFGHSVRLPVKLASRTPSMLLVTWVKSPDVSGSHSVTLYHIELGSYNTLSMDTTTRSHYRFTALDSCSLYVACVEIAGTHSFTCLSTITDPDVPKNFVVSSWNSSSISLVWNCPENRKFSHFLLTAFYLNGTDHITEEVPLWHKGNRLVFVLSDLQPCTRVKFGLQTVCQAGMESRYSKMVLNDGNSVHSSIEALRQTSFGPDNYTLSWEVRNTSSISMFRVYHQGALQGATLITNYTVGGLLPCHQYQAKVEALCGDSVLMNVKTATAHTGPQGVSELTYRPNDSTALWTPGTTHQSTVSFLYQLSLENGSPFQSSHVTDTELRLLGLEEGKTYILDVWEKCDGQWESEHSRLSFQGANSSLELLMRAADSAEDLELQLDISSIALAMVVPWSLPEDLQDDMSEPRAEMVKIVQNKLQELLDGFDPPARIEVATLEPSEEPDKTEILFMSFDASNTEEDVPLPVEDQLDYIHSLDTTNIAVRDGVIYWDGPDVCAASKQTLCPLNSLCINTLGSYTCVCQHGYYDVSSVTPVSSYPACNEKGLFSQCLDKQMTGGIAKPYLTSYIGGKVDVKLNDGRCAADETEMLYYFRTSRKTTECGTKKQVNKTHIEFQNTLTVTLTKEQTISRRDLVVVWKCVYPRHYVRNAQVSMGMGWLYSLSLVEFNSSLRLFLTMTLYSDESYTHSYTDAITIGYEDTLFFQVALQTNNSFASDVVMQVESCWATESSDPQDTVQGVFLQDGCPVDDTFQWLSVNGAAQYSRFCIQIFTMPKGLPLYFHCLANICGHEEDCRKVCSSQQRRKRAVSQMDTKRKQSTVVSAGPLVVNRVQSGVQRPFWPEHMMMISIVVGSIGILGVTVLSVSATKAIMNYYERQLQ